jgi:hypothetical protein
LDCQWLQYLHSVGLLKTSFRPEQAVCEIRALMRHRQNLVEMSSVHVQHMHKSLDQMNLQIHHVINDITGVTGLAIVDAIVAGKQQPERTREIARLSDQSIRGNGHQKFGWRLSARTYLHPQTIADGLPLLPAVNCRLRPGDSTTHRIVPPLPSPNPRQLQPLPILPIPNSTPPTTFDLHSHLERIFGVDLTHIPGFQCLRIQTILSEVGVDLLSKFGTADRFCSWLNLCPKDGSSAGRRVRGAKIKTKNRATQELRMAAQSLHHNQSFLGDYYRSQRARHGAVKAIKNTAHKLARILFHVVTTRQPYDETVFAKLEARNQNRRLHKLQSLAKQMGYSLVEANA